MVRHLENNEAFTSELLEQAVSLRRLGLKWETVAKRLEVGRDGLQRRLDPVYRDKRNQQLREAQARRDNRPLTDLTARIADDQLERLRATVPRDTRGFTARVCGDPLPGRSALDKYRANSGGSVSRERTAFEFSPLLSYSHRDDEIRA